MKDQDLSMASHEDASENPPVFKNRMAKYRYNKKKNEQKWKEHLEKDAKRNKDNRNKAKEEMTDEQKLKKKEETRLRVKAWRAKQRPAQTHHSESTPTKVLGSYKKESTLKKAVFKVRKSLPFSPKKKKAVIRQLLKVEKLTDSDLVQLKQNTIPRKKFCEEMNEQVIKWYETDDISWQAPGKRDCVKIYDPETQKKIQKQKRFLVMTIDEARELFQEKYNVSVSRSKFFDLRPKHVLPVANTPHNVCVCVKHANFAFLVEGLKTAAGLGSNFNHRSLLDLVCCNTMSESCMTNKCKTCTQDIKTVLKENIDLSAITKWKTWQKIEGKYQVVEKTTALQTVVKEINEMLPSFKFHCFVQKVQSAYFDHVKSKINKGTAIIQIDYAENVSLTPQDEIQSGHWGHRQVTLFTACIWYENGVKSYVVVSDDLTHSKESSWVFLKTIISHFKAFCYEDLTNLLIFSDNCSAQFKSKFTTSNICFLANDLNVENVEWSSFAPGHGKGAVDAIGGQLKRQIWIKIKSRSVIINTAQEFFDVCEKTCESVQVLFVPKQDVVETGKMLQQRWENAAEVIGIQKYHHFKKFDEKHILAAFTNRSSMNKHQVVVSPGEKKNKKTKQTPLRYSDVYSGDSESSESVSSCISGVGALWQLENELDRDECAEEQVIEESQIVPDTHVLVKYNTSRNSFTYAAVCQTPVCDDGEVGVLFLTAVGNEGCLFKINEDGEKYVDFEQIVKILPNPDITCAGQDRVHYKYPYPILVNK
ncbi:uncharacterized protein LOC124155107 [Ischnura elegans]|uniref:uncharacterized protein LOC124155107 n=1 Tax=Ischnura elegans TaxID=197161 RepID=UPI001ED8A4FC|nr:uncharacterized protein LOC124155107 [Ischnura elegans]